jgi:hypothetical protein
MVLPLDELMHSILDVMYAKALRSYSTGEAMHIYPTVSELIPSMLGELQPLGTSGSVVAG